MKYKIVIIVLLHCTAYFGQAQQDVPVKNLVFEGAGVLGIIYAGALIGLEEQGVLQNIEKVAGTSSGSITALLVSLGYSTDEMKAIISSTKFQRFNDGQFWIIGGISRMQKRFGWFRGKRLSDWVGKFIEAKTGDANITFAELHRRGFKDLYVTATCLNKQELIILSRETYPKMKVKDAVRISASIPLYFQAVFVDNEGNTFHKQNKKKDLDIMIDGGVIGNFPIQIFDEIIMDSADVEKRIPNFETIGIRTDSDLQITEDKNEQNLAYHEIKNLKEYLIAFHDILIESINRYNLTEDDWKRTISVSTLDIFPSIKNFNAKEKTNLIESGRKGVEEYFHKRS